MKRTMKKHLSIILAVLMLMTSVSCIAFAANGTECTNHKLNLDDPQYRNVVNPTCEDEGYTEYLCVICKAVIHTDNYVKPYEHKWGAEAYEYDAEKDCYYKYYPCTREYADGACKGISYDYADNGEKEIYYCAKFVNNWATDSYNPDVKYTNLAYTYKTIDLHEEKIFVKAGEEVAYEFSRPYRERDTEFGVYHYAGWSTEAGATEPMLSLTVDKNNTVFYPVFEGDQVKYNVTYYGIGTEPLTETIKVVHGGVVPYRENADINGKKYADPEKAADLVNTYEFKNWTVSCDKKSDYVTSEQMDTYPIYDNIILTPNFEATKIKYTVELYEETLDSNGKASYNLYSYNSKAARFENVTLESNLCGSDYPAEIGLINNKNVVKRDSDKTYFYTWTGKWQVLRADGKYGTVVKLNDFKGFSSNDIIVTEGSNGEEIRTIRLVPVFERGLVRYAVDIKMEVPAGEDDSYYLGEAVVQVVSKDGQAVAAGKTNSEGMFRCYLHNEAPFTISVLSYDNKYIGTQTIFNLEKVETGGEEAEAKRNLHKVVMQLNPEYETHCSCIHHNSLLQPIIVRIFNILYTFFNVKYVCCYDMYSTIGPLLEYMPD